MDHKPMNAFAVLGLSPHPVLEEADITRAYDALARLEDVDREELNQARAILVSPAKRLKHWLVWQGYGDSGGQMALDEELMKVFSQASRVFRAAADLNQKRKQATTALAEAILTRPLLRVREALATLQLQLKQIEAEKLGLLSSLFPADEEAGLDMHTARQLAALQGTFTFLERWREQARMAWMELF